MIQVIKMSFGTRDFMNSDNRFKFLKQPWGFPNEKVDIIPRQNVRRLIDENEDSGLSRHDAKVSPCCSNTELLPEAPTLWLCGCGCRPKLG
jgi:hypothetical protein